MLALLAGLHRTRARESAQALARFLDRTAPHCLLSRRLDKTEYFSEAVSATAPMRPARYGVSLALRKEAEVACMGTI